MRDHWTKTTARAAGAAAALALLAAPSGLAQTNQYVVKGNAGANLPFTTWTDAAPSIQDAISACSSGDVVWVRAATYDEGGVTNWPAGSVLTSRVAVTTAYVTVRSEHNDPTNTIIKGRFDTGEPGAEGTVTNGPSAARGVYLADNTRLIGFTITNGATLAAGDLHGAGVLAPTTAAVLSNCVIVGNAAYYPGSGYGGGVRYGTLYNCVIEGNVAGFAAGVSYCTLYHCSVVSNVARQSGGGASYGAAYDSVLSGNRSGANGGGADGSTLVRCTLSGNTASQSGGGAYQATLTGCIVSNNTTLGGGGVRGGTLSNCWLVANYSSWGGGAHEATLYNCLIMGNEARGYQTRGGGAASSRLYNCTVVGNRAGYITNTNTPAPGGGGVSGCGLINSIVYYNQDDTYGYDNYRASTNQYSCTTPEDPGWTEADHNTAEEPRFMANGSGYGTNDFAAGNYQLRGSSPCVNAGTNGSWTAGVDLAGNPRIRYGVVDMGAFECIVNRGVMIRVR